MSKHADHCGHCGHELELPMHVASVNVYYANVNTRHVICSACAAELRAWMRDGHVIEKAKAV